MEVRNHTEYISSSIVFFDGVCNFCNATVDWIWKRNKKENLYFSPLQSNFARKFLKENDIPDIDFRTIYFYDKGTLYARSKAVLRIMTNCNGIIKFTGILLNIVPAFIRDFFYNIIARNRHRILGRRDTCRIPTENEDKQFLE